MAEAPFAQSAARNTAPILETLRREFRDCSRVLEIGSGTGQHAVAFGQELPHLQWQTSDLEENHAGIRAWIARACPENVLPPLLLDVRTAALEAASFDAVYSANTAHIMGMDAVRAMIALAGQVLSANGVFCLYGPFRIGGNFNSPSNATFDAGLRGRDPAMGIRDLETLDQTAAANGLQRRRLYALPSNNHVAVWSKSARVSA
jgi:SAM-dependent methyltransferase